jgi:hypothetical protein
MAHSFVACLNEIERIDIAISRAEARRNAAQREVRTNRTNVRASTGPKTSAGRARSARNALRHGLNVPIADLEVFSPEVERLAEAIGGTQPGDAQLERHVRLVAEADRHAPGTPSAGPLSG